MEPETRNDGMPETGFIRVRDFVGRGKPLPVCTATFYNWARAGLIPKPTKIGPRAAALTVEQARQILDDLRAGRLGGAN